MFYISAIPSQGQTPLGACASGDAAVADVLQGKSADIDCDNFAEDGALSSQTLSVSTDEVKAGVYAATWLSAVDADLVAANLRSGVDIFGIAGTFTSGATAVAGDILSGKTAGVNGSIITGTIVTQTLSALNDMVNAGYYAATTLSAVDADLVAANLRSGVDIFGIAGTFTSGATAVAGDILSGKTAGVSGSIITGTIATRTLSAANDTVNAGYYAATTLSAVDADLTAANIRDGYTVFGILGTFTEGATATAGTIRNAYTAGANGAVITGTIADRTLSAANDTVNAGYYAATTLSAVDADLAAANIKSGVTIFGKAGTLVVGALPDTGQTASYTATFGEDHDYSGVQPSFTDNGDYTITDNNTKLMWKKCLPGQTDNATCTGTASGAYNFVNALTVCEGMVFAGYSDWRVPNIKELNSITDFSKSAAPMLNATYFPNSPTTGNYRSSTTDPNTTTFAYVVALANGAVFSSAKITGTLSYLRCVRAGP